MGEISTLLWSLDSIFPLSLKKSRPANYNILLNSHIEPQNYLKYVNKTISEKNLGYHLNGVYLKYCSANIYHFTENTFLMTNL